MSFVADNMQHTALNNTTVTTSTNATNVTTVTNTTNATTSTNTINATISTNTINTTNVTTAESNASAIISAVQNPPSLNRKKIIFKYTQLNITDRWFILFREYMRTEAILPIDKIYKHEYYDIYKILDAKIHMYDTEIELAKTLLSNVTNVNNVTNVTNSSNNITNVNNSSNNNTINIDQNIKYATDLINTMFGMNFNRQKCYEYYALISIFICIDSIIDDLIMWQNKPFNSDRINGTNICHLMLYTFNTYFINMIHLIIGKKIDHVAQYEQIKMLIYNAVKCNYYNIDEKMNLLCMVATSESNEKTKYNFRTALNDATKDVQYIGNIIKKKLKSYMDKNAVDALNLTPEQYYDFIIKTTYVNSFNILHGTINNPAFYINIANNIQLTQANKVAKT